MTTRHAKHPTKREHHPAPPLPPPVEHPEPAVDVVGVLHHMLDALDHLAQQLGSPPAAHAALAEARALLGKET